MVRRGVIAAIALAALAMVAWAANEAADVSSVAIQGVVVDQAGKPVRGATVTAFDDAEKMSVSVYSKEDGTFRIAGLDAKDYTLRARLLGLLPFGLVCGLGAAAAGADWLAALGMSAIIFSGAAQILAGQLLAADAPVAVIVLTCFVAGLRFLMYSAAMAPHMKPLPPHWQKGLAFLMTDQVFAAAIRRFSSAASVP